MARHFWGLYFKPTELIGAIGNAALAVLLLHLQSLRSLP